jgi:hypothetical protein
MGTRSAVARLREGPNESTRRQRALRDAIDVQSSLAGFTTPMWWHPAGEKDTHQHTKLWAVSALAEIEPSDLKRRWASLSKAKRTFLVLVGVSGDLAKAANASPPNDEDTLHPKHYVRTVALAHRQPANDILAAHRGAGWHGVLAYLLAAIYGDGKCDHRLLWQATMFGRWGFVPDWCEYRRHSYFRPTKGRRPNACVLHQKAARQAHYRASPDQRRKRAEVARKRKLRAR